MFYWIYRDICSDFVRYEVDVIENNHCTCIIFIEKTSNFCVNFNIYIYVHVYHIVMILVSSSINIKDLIMYIILIFITIIIWHNNQW